VTETNGVGVVVPLKLIVSGLSAASTLVEDRLTIGADGMAVPVSATVCGLGGLVALSAILNVPVRVPVAVGEKVTFMVQIAPAATLPPQLSVSANSEAFVPVKAKPERVKAESPVLFNVMP
jgi:hypothetical protein